MIISEKIQTTNNKIEQNKAQHNLNRQTDKISTLSSDQKLLVNTNFWQAKTAIMKKFKYSPLGEELKKQTSVAEKQYQSIDKNFNYDGKEEPVTSH